MAEESQGNQTEDKIIKERKEKILKFLKNSQLWVWVILVIALLFGIYTRILPMVDHDHGKIPTFLDFVFTPANVFNGRPGLWDITTNSWTLGPDLDPWCFERYAKIIIQTKSLPEIDHMRNVPLGFNTQIELQMVSYMIVLTYKITNIFGNYSVEFAADINPVIMFGFTVIVFFLFVREVFIRKTKESKTIANIIALISTFFMIVSPAFLSRTVAGIPEKEANGFVFMFLAFYLFLKSWKSEKIRNSVIFAILAGFSTVIMSLTWGGAVYVNVTIIFSCLVAFIIGKFGKKESIAYSIWIFMTIFLPFLFTNRYSLIATLTSIDTGLGVFLFFTLGVNWILWGSKKIKIKKLNDIKLPKNLISLIVSAVLLVVIILLLLGPSFFVEKINAINGMIFHPITGRWSTTVAENRQPDFKEWSSSFGPFIGNIPVLFWLFFIGSIVLFRIVINKINKKDAWILTGFYVLFLLGLIFSRYSSASIFNGENFISKAFYYLSALLFIGSVIYYYIDYNKKGNKTFEGIEYEFILLFLLFILTIFTARSAVRLIMVLAPIAPIFVSFLIVESLNYFRKSKDETLKVFVGIIAVAIILASLFVFQNFYNQIKSESYSFVPSYYNQQWQKAMEWVRNDTPKDAVFAHWWDYGYWVQSIGDRATVLDGANAQPFWNYYMGRLVLTGDNQKDSLDFLYNHNATYLLIDSSDIGKYGAFASIGSDANFDRYSWIGTFVMDEKQTQETNNQTLFVYSGGIPLDEDLLINDSGKEVFLPAQRSFAGLIIIPQIQNGNQTQFGQPYSIMVYQGKQYKVNFRYLSIGGKFIDYKSGIDACAYIFPSLSSDGQRVGENPIGASMYLSPRLLRGYFAQKYILDDPFNKFPNFKLVHTEQNIIIDSLKSQGMNLPDFVYFQGGIQGPIKIWNINYTGKEKVEQKYLDTDSTKYLTWRLV